mgnify:CR=1 FL=1
MISGSFSNEAMRAEAPSEKGLRVRTAIGAVLTLAGIGGVAYASLAKTADGLAVDLLANVQDGAAARKASSSEARGVGLFRTELCFLDSQTEPSVEQQADIYRPVFEAFPNNKVVVRTLDAGSDKPVAFANMEEEENPALGVRGLRITGQNPELLQHQLDAIAEARNVPVAQVAVNWITVHPLVDTALMGVRNKLELVAALRHQ